MLPADEMASYAAERHETCGAGVREEANRKDGRSENIEADIVQALTTTRKPRRTYAGRGREEERRERVRETENERGGGFPIDIPWPP